MKEESKHFVNLKEYPKKGWLLKSKEPEMQATTPRAQESTVPERRKSRRSETERRIDNRKKKKTTSIWAWHTPTKSSTMRSWL